MGSAAGGAYSAPPNTLAVFKGPTSKEWKGKEKDEKRKGRRGASPSSQYFGLEMPLLDTPHLNRRPMTNAPIKDISDASVTLSYSIEYTCK